MHAEPAAAECGSVHSSASTRARMKGGQITAWPTVAGLRASILDGSARHQLDYLASFRQRGIAPLRRNCSANSAWTPAKKVNALSRTRNPTRRSAAICDERNCASSDDPPPGSTHRPPRVIQQSSAPIRKKVCCCVVFVLCCCVFIFFFFLFCCGFFFFFFFFFCFFFFLCFFLPAAHSVRFHPISSASSKG